MRASSKASQPSMAGNPRLLGMALVFSSRSELSGV